MLRFPTPIFSRGLLEVSRLFVLEPNGSFSGGLWTMRVQVKSFFCFHHELFQAQAFQIY